MKEEIIDIAKSYIQKNKDQFVQDNAVQLYEILGGFYEHLTSSGDLVNPGDLKKQASQKRTVHATDGSEIEIETCTVCGGERFKVLNRPESG